MGAISSGHFSHDTQLVDAVSWIENNDPDTYAELVEAFPEWSERIMAGSWFDTTMMGVDPEWSSWVTDWVEENSLVFWSDGEPYVWLAEDAATMVESLTAFRLANECDVPCPDAPGSPGGRFLTSVASSVAEWIRDADDWTDEEERTDAASEIADSAPSVYTHDLWLQFVDLCAYREDPSELGATSDDMEQCARVCLYIIAERLCHRLFELADEKDA